MSHNPARKMRRRAMPSKRELIRAVLQRDALLNEVQARSAAEEQRARVEAAGIVLPPRS